MGNRIMKFVFLLLVTAIFAASIDKEDGNRNGHSLINIPPAKTRSVEACCNEEHLLLCTEVTVDPAVLLSGEDISILGSDLLFDSTMEPHGFVYHNTLGDEAVITYNNKTGSMFGSLKTHDDKSYAIEKCHHGHVIKEYDMASFEDDQTERSLEPVMKTLELENRVDDTTTVVAYSIMFYYTQAFEDNTADIDGFIEQGLAETNQGYINSQIPIRASKLCAEKATVAENSNVLSNFAKMKQGSSSKLRNSADAAALLVQDCDYCGMASSFTYNTGNTVSVTKKSCALGYYSFGHGIAHNLGALHNPEVSNNNIFPEGHGHLIDLGSGSNSNGYRTILGYYANGHSHRVNYYSNPNVIFPETGTPTGVADISDNAAVLTKNRFMMAALGDESLDCSSTPSTTGGGDGEIKSPNYPNLYPHNLDETWNLEVASGQKIKLTFESFDLESHSSCVYDYVKISFGSDEEKYCGSSKPSPIISSGNTMTVVFHSDYSVNRNGFKATWEAVEISGEIQSPNYPAVYPHNLDETWNLEAASGKRVKLTFESFRLESHSTCRYDYLQISFGSQEEKYCGSDVPSPIISSGNTMAITFHSDHTKVKKGFKATWEAV